MDMTTDSQPAFRRDAIDTPQSLDTPPPAGGGGVVDVSVLVVGYRSKDLLDGCLGSLYAHTSGVTMEVLFLDCSDDGSAELIADRFPQVTVVPNTENLGFGRGNNVLARHATGRYILLLNPDTELNDNAVGRLVAFADARPDGGAWGGMTVLPTGKIDPGCQQPPPGLGPTFQRLIGRTKHSLPKVSLETTEPCEVASLSGAFMMLRRDLWEELGGFDETFFMYSEETDLCYRVKKAGGKVLMTPDAKVVHLVGSGSADSPGRMLAMTRGTSHFNRKHFGWLYCVISNVMFWLISFIRYVAGWIGIPLTGRERAARLRRRHGVIVWTPWRWSRGWSDRR